MQHQQKQQANKPSKPFKQTITTRGLFAYEIFHFNRENYIYIHFLAFHEYFHYKFKILSKLIEFKLE